MNGKKIAKMSFSPEEQQIFNNIFALLKELQTMGGSDEDMPEQPPMGEEQKQENEMERPPMEEEEINKGIESTSSDGGTANDDAGERDEKNYTNITDEGINEVAKAILQMAKRKEVNKNSVNKETNNIAPVLNELAKTMKSINDRQQETEQTIEKILKGLGVAKYIEDEEQKTEKSKPVHGNQELQKILEYVTKSLGDGKTEDTKENNYTGVSDNKIKARKSIRNMLTSGLIQGGK